MDLYPAIDLRAGEAVRLFQGRFDQVSHYGDPAALAARYVAAGARWLHVVDLDGAQTGTGTNRDLAVQLARDAPVPVQFGGGVRGEAEVDTLLGAGMARVVLGTAALEDPAMVVRAARRHPGRIALGLDYRRHGDVLEPAVRGWASGSDTTLEAVLASFSDEPLGAVVVTAIERDGTLTGPDLEGLGAVLDATQLAVVASGGVGEVADLDALCRLRGPRRSRALAGAIAGRALVDGRLDVGEAVARCAACG